MAAKTENSLHEVMIHEGRIRLLIPDSRKYVNSPSDYAPSKAPVFYNPVMGFSRDLSVVALQTYQHMTGNQLTICEPLTATGVRGIRYASEVKGLQTVVIGDISSKAVTLAEKNVVLNDLSNKIRVEHTHANKILLEHSAPRSRFNVIDLDPFGTPVPYIDSAVQALLSGGLLAVTATDMAPLCGVHPKACIRKYGGKPLRTEYAHEIAVRLLTGAIARTAAKHDMATEPVFSYYADHYVRVHATLRYGAKLADETLKGIGYLLHCFQCFHRETVQEFQLDSSSMYCRECGSKLSLAGPLWTGKIIDKVFSMNMLRDSERRLFRNNRKIEKTLSTAIAEADATPCYYDIDAICDHLACPVPPLATVVDSLKRMKFEATPTLFSHSGLRSSSMASQVKEAVSEAVSQQAEKDSATR